MKWRYVCPVCGARFRADAGADCPFTASHRTDGKVYTEARHIFNSVRLWTIVFFVFVGLYLVAHNELYSHCLIQPAITAWPSQCF